MKILLAFVLFLCAIRPIEAQIADYGRQLEAIHSAQSAADFIARLDYDMAGLDASTVFLTFYYPHQPPKRVEDYGQKGTYGLRRLYDLLSDTYEQAEKRQEAR